MNLLVNDYIPGESVIWYTEENAGFPYRLVATFTEWIVAIFMLIYILSITKELKSLEFEQVRFRNKCIVNR